MKYNISNLDEFKVNHEGITQDVKPTNITSSICNDIAESIQNLIEEKVKELIKPYVDSDLIENKKIFEIRDILKERGYILLCNRDNSSYDEYCIGEDATGIKDFFLVKNNVYIRQEENKYIATKYISDIVRNIDK